MTFFAGHNGVVRLRRNTRKNTLSVNVAPNDVNTTLNRFSFDGAEDELLTGDFISISTTDSRGLEFLPLSFWSWIDNITEPQEKAGFYGNINAMGGIRVFNQFNDAVNNTRANETALNEFTGAPIPIKVEIEDTNFNTLGKVTGFTLNTEREAVEITSLNDKFRQQYSAGLISGSGSIDALFAYDTEGAEETSLLMIQLIQRVESGSSFEAALFLTTDEAYGSASNVWYQFEAVVTRAGVEVGSDGIISCAIDFLTTGEVRVQVGDTSDPFLKEDEGKILLNNYTVDALLTEVSD